MRRSESADLPTSSARVSGNPEMDLFEAILTRIDLILAEYLKVLRKDAAP